MKKKTLLLLATVAFAAFLSGCSDETKDVIVSPDPLSFDNFSTGYITMTELTEQLGVEWSWSLLPAGMQMDVTVLREGQPYTHELTRATNIVQKNLESNVRFDYIFRLYDGSAYSDAILKTYTRAGATSLSGLVVSQQEGSTGYEALLEWKPSPDATQIVVTGSNGSRQIEADIDGKLTQYAVEGITEGEEWTFTLTAKNESGPALPVTTTLKTGKQKVGFLSCYASPEELVEQGDDDEASAWLWFHSEYPNSRYVYAGDIKSKSDIDDLRVLFYIRDLDRGTENDVWNQPQVLQDATPYITEWYKEGGNLCLWQHAVTFITDLGRIDRGLLRSNERRITIGAGSWNQGQWFMAVQINPGSYFVEDFSGHPLYKDVDVWASGRSKYITVKGPAWTEDHNCCFFNIPNRLTGISDQDPRCYDVLTETYGIYPLAVWDSQIDWVSQLNVWEARQGNTQFKGTVLCMGNGGLEFSYKNADGTPDKSAYPKNSPFQSTVLKIAKNAIEYLKTR